MKGLVKATILLSVLIFVGIGSWKLFASIDADTVKILLGVLLCLIIVVIVGALFILHAVLQGNVLERQRRRDQEADDQRQAWARIMAGRGAPSLSLNMPEQMQQQHMLPPGGFYDGAYVDTTAEPVEIE